VPTPSGFEQNPSSRYGVVRACRTLKELPDWTPVLRRPWWLGGLLALHLMAAGEVVCALGAGAPSYNGYQDQRPTGDAMQLAGDINNALRSVCQPRCPQIAIFRNATAPNAMLVVGNNGDAKIVYAPQFFTAIYDGYGDGAILVVIAHLFGHALDETTAAPWSKPLGSPELRADAWAGCALARTNLTARGLQETLAAASKYPPVARVSWDQRVTALRLGYTQCGGEGTKFDAAGSTRKRQ